MAGPRATSIWLAYVAGTAIVWSSTRLVFPTSRTSLGSGRVDRSGRWLERVNASLDYRADKSDRRLRSVDAQRK